MKAANQRPKVNLGIRGTREERTRLKRLAQSRETTIQELVEATIRQHLFEGGGPAVIVPGLSRENEKWVMLCGAILARNVNDDLDRVLKTNLIAVAKMVELNVGNSPVSNAIEMVDGGKRLRAELARIQGEVEQVVYQFIQTKFHPPPDAGYPLREVPANPDPPPESAQP
jgi:hypothetical protein